MPAILATRGLGQGHLVPSRGLGRSVADLGGFGSGWPYWKFRRLDEEPRRLKVKSKVVEREIEFEAPRRELLESADAVQRQIDQVRQAQAQAEAVFQDLLRRQRQQDLIEELMARLEEREQALAEALIAEELRQIRDFLRMVDDLILRLILVKRKRADEEVLVMILGSNILH